MIKKDKDKLKLEGLKLIDCVFNSKYTVDFDILLSLISKNEIYLKYYLNKNYSIGNNKSEVDLLRIINFLPNKLDYIFVYLLLIVNNITNFKSEKDKTIEILFEKIEKIALKGHLTQLNKLGEYLDTNKKYKLVSDIFVLLQNFEKNKTNKIYNYFYKYIEKYPNDRLSKIISENKNIKISIYEPEYIEFVFRMENYLEWENKYFVGYKYYGNDIYLISENEEIFGTRDYNIVNIVLKKDFEDYQLVKKIL